MVTDHEMEQMKRGFVGGGLVFCGIFALAALVVTILGFEWGLWLLLTMLVLEAAFLVVAIRRHRNGRARPGP